MEQWHDVSGFEGLYQVSNFGNVRSLPRKISAGHGNRIAGGKEINKTNDGNGYLSVMMSDRGRLKRIRVHRLVALAFIPAIAGKNFVNHKDSNRQNNHVSNLEWVTQKENTQHGMIFGNLDNKRGKNSQAKAVLHLQTGVFFDCLKDGAECFGVNYSKAK